MTNKIVSIDQSIFDRFDCVLLHQKAPYWDGTYIYSDLLEKHVKKIVWICNECDKK